MTGNQTLTSSETKTSLSLAEYPQSKDVSKQLLSSCCWLLLQCPQATWRHLQRVEAPQPTLKQSSSPPYAQAQISQLLQGRFIYEIKQDVQA